MFEMWTLFLRHDDYPPKAPLPDHGLIQGWLMTSSFIQSVDILVDLVAKNSSIFCLKARKSSSLSQLISFGPKPSHLTRYSLMILLDTTITLSARISLTRYFDGGFMLMVFLVDWLRLASEGFAWYGFKLLTWNTGCTFIHLGGSIL